ncbi:MAG: SLC13 family permease [Brevinematales bacterium]|nr:SLC13 family permease [Brevinematales bacterium]
MSELHISLLIFIFVYVVISARQTTIFNLDSTSVVLVGSLFMILFGVMTLEEAFHSIDPNTIFLLIGTMIFSAYLERTRFFEFTSIWFIKKSKVPSIMLLVIMILSAFLSAFFVNDTVCLLMTPLVIAITRRSNLNPVPFLLGLVMSSNVGSAMTLIGNPQNMIIAVSSGLEFSRYFFYVFPLVIVCLFVIYFFILLLFKKDISNSKLDLNLPIYRVPQPYVRILYRLGVLFVLFVMLLFLPIESYLGISRSDKLPLVAMMIGSLAIMLGRFRPDETLKMVDWTLILFFSGLFMVVEGVRKGGVIELMYSLLSPYFGNTELKQYLSFSFLTLIGSNIVSNVPYVVLAKSWVSNFVNPDKVWVLLAVISTFAGNLTVIGSVANIIVLEKSKRFANINFWTYSKVGVPITIITSTLAVVYLILMPF